MTPFPKELRASLERRYPERFDLDVGSDNLAIVTVVDDSFAGMNREDRLRDIQKMIEEAGLTPGLIDAYTSAEASERGVAIRKREQSLSPANLSDAVDMIAAGIAVEKRPLPSATVRKAVFYSYKGGVGRTTSLVHTAFHLARAGQRVVVVDMDVEAPGLHLLLPRQDGAPVAQGLVDYLYRAPETHGRSSKES